MDAKRGDVIAVRGFGGPDEQELVVVDPTKRTAYIRTRRGRRTPTGTIDGFLKFGYWDAPETAADRAHKAIAAAFDKPTAAAALEIAQAFIAANPDDPEVDSVMEEIDSLMLLLTAPLEGE